MSAAAHIIDQTRGMAAALIKHEERRTGSRMLAYERVAASIGASASWVRKFAAGSPNAKCPNFVAGLNILAQYDRLVAAIDAGADREKETADRLWGDVHAAHPRAAAMVAGTDQAEAGGEDHPADET